MAEPIAAATRVVAFLNSRGVGFAAGQDQLRSATESLSVLKLFDSRTKRIEPYALGQLRDLRAVLLDLRQKPEDRKSYKGLENFSKTVSFRPEISGEGEAKWIQTDGDPILGTILADVHELVHSGQWRRIKNCANDACSATFFDETRSGTQKWHSYATCGNRSNVAAFRSRLG